jgi:hypothetical protein
VNLQEKHTIGRRDPNLPRWAQRATQTDARTRDSVRASARPRKLPKTDGPARPFGSPGWRCPDILAWADRPSDRGCLLAATSRAPASTCSLPFSSSHTAGVPHFTYVAGCPLGPSLQVVGPFDRCHPGTCSIVSCLPRTTFSFACKSITNIAASAMRMRSTPAIALCEKPAS